MRLRPLSQPVRFHIFEDLTAVDNSLAPPFPSTEIGSRPNATDIDGRDNWLRGWVEVQTRDGKWTIKGLNVDWVPEPVLGRAGVAMRSDGRFGKEDPLLWPQVVAPNKIHLVFIPRRPSATHPVAILWETPTAAVFERVNDEPEGSPYGRLSGHTFQLLSAVVEPLRQRVDEVSLAEQAKTRSLPPEAAEARRKEWSQHREVQMRVLHSQLCVALDMFRVPSTLRECIAQWGHLHRCYTELWAWLEWLQASDEAAQKLPHELVQLHQGLDGRGVMGGFTTDKRIATKLYLAGAPTWMLIRTLTAAPSAKATISLSKAELPPDMEPLLIHYAAELVGDGHISAIWRRSHAVLDVEHVPLPEDYSLAVTEPSRSPTTAPTYLRAPMRNTG